MPSRKAVRAINSSTILVTLAFGAALGSSPPQATAGEMLDIDWAVGGYGGAVTGARFTSDGALIATSSGDGTVKLWDPASRQLLRTLFPMIIGGFPSSGISISPEDSHVAAASVGGGYIWNLTDTQDVAPLIGLESGVDTAFSPDGLWVAVVGSGSGSQDSTLLFRRSDHQLEWGVHIEGFAGVNAAVFTNDSATLITGGSNELFGPDTGRIRYFRVSDGEVTATLTDHTDAILDVDLSPDGTLFASASADDTVKLWDVAAESVIRTLTGHTDNVTHVAFSPDGTRIASVGEDGQIRLWRVSDGKPLLATPTNPLPLASVEWSPDGASFLVGSGRLFGFGSNTLRLLDADDATPLSQFNEYEFGIVGLDVSPDGSRVVTTDLFSAVAVRDATDGALVQTIDPLTTQAVVAIGPEGHTVATGGVDGQVRIWNVSDGALLHTIPAHPDRVAALDISPNGEFVLSTSITEEIEIRRLDTGELVSTVNAMPFFNALVRFMPDSQHVVAGAGFTATIYRVNDGTFVRFFSGHTALIRALAVSPDGETLAISANDTTIRLWDTETGEMLHTMTGHQSGPALMAFSGDGATLATSAASDLEPLRFWSVDDGEQIASFHADVGSVLSGMTFSPDNASLLFSRPDGTLVSAANPFGGLPGDIDGDGDLDEDDVTAFVAVLLDSPIDPAHAARSDLNNDAATDGLDISAFLEILLGP